MNLPTQEDFSSMFIANGKFTFRSLFWEYTTPASRAKHPPLFTLKPREHNGLPSAYLVYMESVDEYDAATKLCPNMRIWDQLKAAEWFMNGDPLHSHDGLVVWREHMKARDSSAMKKLLQEKAQGGDTTAMKTLLAETKNKAPVGRKTKKASETAEEKKKKDQMKEWRNKQEQAKKRAAK